MQIILRGLRSIKLSATNAHNYLGSPQAVSKYCGYSLTTT